MILSAAPFPPRGPEGVANYVYNLGGKLVQRGHSVVVVTRGSLRLRQRIVNRDLSIFEVPMVPVYPFHVHIQGIFVNKLIKSLESKLDIIHAHSPYVPAVRTSLPLLTTIHTLEKADVAKYETQGLRSLAFKMTSNFFSRLERELFENSEMLTAVAGHIFRDLTSIYKLNRGGVVIGNGVDERVFVPPNRTKTGRHVLYVGRIDYRKGLFDLIKCAKIVTDEEPNIIFLLVGGGPLSRIILRHVRNLGLERRVILMGYVSRDKLVTLYQNAAAFVMPSYYEGLPTVILEAMACAVPVVATRIDGHSDVIRDGINGFLIPVRSPRSMAECILNLLRNEDATNDVRKAARQTIKNAYTWDRISQKFLSCYEALLKA